VDLSLSEHKEKSESQKHIEKLCKEYIEGHIREQELLKLIEENNREKETIRGYHGREILELLQNADDAYYRSIDEGEKLEDELEVSIKFKESVLTVSNTGTFFDKDGINAIVQGNVSPKSGKYIGNKGTGFRSVLNWAKEVRIHSGDYNVRFSEEFANKLFQEYKSEKQIEKQIKSPLRRGPLYFPMLSVPENINPLPNHNMTLIKIFIDEDEDKAKDDFGVEEQINNIDLRILLFLPNMKRIKIEIDSEEIIYERENIPGVFKEFSLKKYVNKELQTEEQFYIFNKVIEKAIEENKDEEKKDIRLAIAVPKDFEDFKVGKVYTFFPLLNVESPFNCVLHATYILGANRDTITRDNANKTVIIEQLKFLVEVAEKFASKQYEDTALRLLTPVNFKQKDWKFPSAFSLPFSDLDSKLKLEEKYFDLLENAKVIQTVNDEYISIKDMPKMFDCDFPDFFKGAEFITLLKPVYEEVVPFVRYLSQRSNHSLNMEEDELLPIINCIKDSWGKDRQVAVFSWWNRDYYDSSGGLGSLPELLKIQNGRWLGFGEECYFLVGGFEDRKPPSWIKVPSLESEYQELLFEDAKQLPKIKEAEEANKGTHISRLISQKRVYPTVKFTYSDRSNIILAVNSSVDNYDQSIDFVKWLWKDYRNESEEWTPPRVSESSSSASSSIKYNFPGANRNIQDSRKLYLGREYGNDLSERLFDETYEAFPSLDSFGVDENEVQDFVEFVSKFGVKKFPQIEQQKVDPSEAYKAKYEEKIKKEIDIGTSTSVSIRCELPFIKDIEIKLQRLTTIDVVRWICDDYSLKICLRNPLYPTENSKIEYRGNKQHYYWTYYGEIENYLLHVFNEVPWVEIKGERYSPRQVLKESGARINSKFSDLVPVLDTKTIQDMAQSLNTDYEKILEVIELFDFCERITDLGSEDFYRLMLELPDYDDFKISADLSETLYRIIEQSNFKKVYGDSESKKKFFDVGKVLVEYKGTQQYYPAKESYLPSANIINKKSVPIVKKGQRTNNENFVTTFGCQQYSKEYSVQDNPEPTPNRESNPKFQEHFSDFLKYAVAYGDRNENFGGAVNSLSVTLVNQIFVEVEDEQSKQLLEITEEYTCIKGSSTRWYITVFGNDYDVNRISEEIENLCSNIANTPGFESGKLGELFRAKENSDREFLIKKEFGSLDVIADGNYQDERKRNFIETVQKIDENYPVDEMEIDFENFSSEQNAEKIIELFLRIGTDVKEFEKKGFLYRINLIPYYKTRLNGIITKEKRRFKNDLYTRAIEDESLQKDFLDTVSEFENFRIEEEKYKNSVNFDVESFVCERFADYYNSGLQGNELLDSQKKYSKNYESLNPEKLFEEEIANSTKVQQMIYFNKTEEFNDWVAKQKDSQRLHTSEPVDNYSEYRDIVPEEGELIFSEPSDNRKSSGKHKSSGSYTYSSAERRSRAQKVFGNKGELLVYNLLCQDFGKENVYPRSEAFVELDILKPGQAISGEYDISYKDESGTEFFVEVKTGDGRFFIISPDELEFAKQNANNFELFLVYDIDSESPKYLKLPKKFWEDGKFRQNSVVERIEFEF